MADSDKLPERVLNQEEENDPNGKEFEEKFEKLEKIKEDIKKDTPLTEEERQKLLKEKEELLEQIKELEEDYYHPKEKMPDEEVEKITQDLMQHPLFLKEMPENIEDNEHLVALQNILYDDEPENIAKYSNEKGNEFFKKGQDKKYYMDKAKECYTDGIEAKGKDYLMNSKLYNNRALINIKQKNYGKAIDDAKDSIKCNPKFIKPYFRCAQAMVYLHKYKQAIEMLKEGKKLDPKNKEFIKFLKETEEKLAKENAKKQQKDDVKKSEQNVLHNALKLRNIYLGKPIMDFPDGVTKCCWIDEEGKLHFPTFIQYPEFQQMDYIQDIQEDHILQDHVDHLIGEKLPYDQQGIYNSKNVELYIELNQTETYYDIKNAKEWPRVRGLVKIDSLKKYKQILATKGYILPKVVEIFMVCPDSKVFYNHFRQNFDFVSASDLKIRK